VSDRPLSIAVIGARRRRQGTGEYVARDLARQGCDVAAVVGTSAERAAEAASALAERYGIACRAYGSLAAALAAERLDAVAVCSPARHHLDALEAAAAAGLHAFAEKPLWWPDGDDAPDPDALAERARGLAGRFAAAGRTLHLNTQWPYTLPAFEAVHPGVLAGPVERFRMWLGPTVAGPRAVVESAPHFLSLLWAIAGPGRPEEVEVGRAPAAGGLDRLTLRCRWTRPGGAAVAAELVLEPRPEPPRPAGYAVDGHTMERQVTLPSYEIAFVGPGGARASVGDPLTASVAAFVAAARAGAAPPTEELAAGMADLARLVAAAERRECV